MKRIAGATLILLALTFLAPALLAQEEHGEFGVYADYYRFHNLANQNFWGLGGNLAFNLNKYAQVEGTMSFDFERNFTTNNTPLFGTSTNFQRTGFRILSGLFGPKIQTGVGPVKGFFTVKAGFDNFMVTDKGPVTGFANQVSNVPSGDTHFALYPGGGLEFFFGHVFGFRGEVGDEMYWQNGANHNLRIKIGPQFRW